MGTATKTNRFQHPSDPWLAVKRVETATRDLQEKLELIVNALRCEIDELRKATSKANRVIEKLLREREDSNLEQNEHDKSRHLI